MTEEPHPEWIEAVAKLLSTVGAEVLLSPLGVPGLAAGTTVVLEYLTTQRRSKGVEHLGYVVHRVGEDRLRGIIQSDDERSEILWTSTQASMATSHQGKRVYLARVTANAMTSDEAIDEAQLIVTALNELVGPHIRALTVIRNVQDANSDNEELDDIVHEIVRKQPYPVLATLARTGVVRQGSEERSPGLYSIMFADSLGITGVSDFGRNLLADLESVDPDVW